MQKNVQTSCICEGAKYSIGPAMFVKKFSFIQSMKQELQFGRCFFPFYSSMPPCFPDVSGKREQDSVRKISVRINHFYERCWCDYSHLACRPLDCAPVLWTLRLCKTAHINFALQLLVVSTTSLSRSFVRKLVALKGKKWLSACVPDCIFHQREFGRILPSSCRILQYISGHFWSQWH